MKITIEIPDTFRNGEDSMINIIGETFEYSRPDSRFHGIQSNFSQTEDQKDAALLEQCDSIADHVLKMIKEELI